LPADRATEFHGNPERSDLSLGMAGNQWVVFDKVLQGFNLYRGMGDGTQPRHLPNPEWTLEKLNAPANRYYVQLIPPGQIRNQIKSGCMVLGNDEERNFLPGNIQVDFDVFSSTNYNLMRDLAANGFVTEALPYIKNKLDLMVAEDNPLGIGSGGASGTYAHIYDIVMDLLDPAIVVSEVDHINEGVHRAINNMYKSMDETIREYGASTDIAALDSALALVAMPQPGSPAETRTLEEGITTDFNLATNPECHYSGHPSIPDGTLRFCEYAVLNKANTHETRVHHVETPGGILGEVGFEPVDVGPVWVSELGYQLVRNVPVEGMVPGVFPPPGVVGPADAEPVINNPATYSIAVLRKSENSSRNGRRRHLAEGFVDYLRSPEGQTAYTDGGFIGLTPAELNGGECYSLAKDGTLVITPRDGGC
jgi:ABC-type molybdate transport system substrate-binding protein